VKKLAMNNMKRFSHHPGKSEISQNVEASEHKHFELPRVTIIENMDPSSCANISSRVLENLLKFAQRPLVG
jgi:hypothetical protein